MEYGRASKEEREMTSNGRDGVWNIAGPSHHEYVVTVLLQATKIRDAKAIQ